MDYANYNISKDISNQPEDARSMALLANVLIEKVKRASHSDHHQHHELKEALSLANTSIKLSPTESIGYAVLSTITLLKFEQRMIYLRKAVDIEQQTVKRYPNNISSRVAIITSLVRLLLEPREEMARNKEKTTAKHIMRQNLGINSLTRLNEQSIYEELKLMLDDTKTTIWNKREERWKEQHQKEDGGERTTLFSSIPNTIQCLAKAHYRLGTVFRTMQPTTAHCPKSKYHFHSVLDLLNPPYMHTSFKLQPYSSELYSLVVKAKFWLATLQHGVDGIISKEVERCPSEYVVSLYSSFADTFDNQLVNKLKYQTPAKLRHLVDEVAHQSTSGVQCFDYAADLGCGTGLSGRAFHDLTTHLVGVDLSPEMIEKAKITGCYTSLHVGDVESILKKETYDMIIACDVFVYIGNLQSIFQSVSKCLNPKHGLFAFSTELLDEDHEMEKGSSGFLLQSCARFAHKQSYIQNLAEQFGYVVRSMKKDVIRKNAGKDVNGLLTVLSLK